MKSGKTEGGAGDEKTMNDVSLGQEKNMEQDRPKSCKKRKMRGESKVWGREEHGYDAVRETRGGISPKNIQM